MNSHKDMNGYYLLCPCRWCSEKRGAEAEKHSLSCKRKDGSACRNHTITVCHCDCREKGNQ
jgi:hypothetical protein